MRKVTKIGAGGGLAAAGLGMLVASGVFTASAAIVVGPGLATRERRGRPDGVRLLRRSSSRGTERRVCAASAPTAGTAVGPSYDAMEGNATSGRSETRSSAPAPSGTDVAVGSSETGTNTQETGVDEPDRAKTDGTVLVRVVGHSVLLSRRHRRPAAGTGLLPASGLRLRRGGDAGR